MTDDDIKSAIKKEEGLRLDVYADSCGLPTIGYGHLLQGKISQRVADLMFEDDFAIAAADYETLGLDLDPVRRAAVVDMLYNMGLARVKNFQHFLFALKEKDYPRAANELMDSRYARQLPKRATRNRDRILNGG